MSRTGISFVFAGFSAVALTAGVARAEGGYLLQSDPSGAPQCMGPHGEKAPLASCHIAQADPSGAPQCFTQTGQKAPLAYCRAVAPFSYVVQLDPSGAPMCMTSTGNKAPLARCAAMLPAQQTVVAAR
jgi:hypothetical protein